MAQIQNLRHRARLGAQALVPPPPAQARLAAHRAAVVRAVPPEAVDLPQVVGLHLALLRVVANRCCVF